MRAVDYFAYLIFIIVVCALFVYGMAYIMLRLYA